MATADHRPNPATDPTADQLDDGAPARDAFILPAFMLSGSLEELNEIADGHLPPRGTVVTVPLAGDARAPIQPDRVAASVPTRLALGFRGLSTRSSPALLSTSSSSSSSSSSLYIPPAQTSASSSSLFASTKPANAVTATSPTKHPATGVPTAIPVATEAASRQPASGKRRPSKGSSMLNVIFHTSESATAPVAEGAAAAESANGTAPSQTAASPAVKRVNLTGIFARYMPRRNSYEFGATPSPPSSHASLDPIAEVPDEDVKAPRPLSGTPAPVVP